jgi:hypothetical protein
MCQPKTLRGIWRRVESASWLSGEDYGARALAMRWKRLWAIARKEIIQVMRDWRSLVIIALMLIVLTLLYGYGVTPDIKHIPMYVFDREGSQRSQDLLKGF